MFDTILIANRGEIACRVIRTCRRLGIRTVAVYSSADADAQHVRQADVAIAIGGPRPAESYLRGDAIIEAALATGAQAVHPGYGFLSENADFADAVATAGLAFIGPSGDSMRRMGSKAGAKELMAAHGVPVVPGYTGEDQDPARLAAEAGRIGFPLMIKAAYGGGGKGMRIVREAGEFAGLLESCQREAKNAFGRDRVLLERYVERPRHIELQVFGDRHGHAIHLNERECSAQRRYQKVLEETPSPFVTPSLRAAMGAAAVAAARALDYVNAGTVEFIVGEAGDFYFMEINTRLQVEHPVTECVTGLDLVELQLRIAAGEPLPAELLAGPVTSRGHAIELRLYAEDPEQGFLPGSGRLETLRLPTADAHVRIDAGVVEGDTVTIFYDPMIAKLIVHDVDRAAALQRMREALAAIDVVGPKSNVAFLERLVRHPAVVEGRIDTGYLDRHLDEFIGADDAAGNDALVAAVVATLLDEEAAAVQAARASGDPHSPWGRADGWRSGHAGKRVIALVDGAGQRHAVAAFGAGGDYRIELDGRTIEIAGARLDGGTLSARYDGNGRRHRLFTDARRVVIHDGTRRSGFGHAPAFVGTSVKASGEDRIKAPMPGRVVVVRCTAGDVVAEGQELLVMEAMKMELSLRAPRAGMIEAVQAAAGDFVEADAVLVRFAAGDAK
ncbi:MAG TPA: biotin carboxylase N-terminal domain-containing protein [Dokdonella sp.]|uniref:acetyl/propionyl/methylcrotonyl-CoA carboxylase subunit alpha n=1 Tax=Dokdonella sp. TaxID=2291710 RepID=UPI0025C38D28|nr:biotin carboxylase N-terminal domain-containing protein [Dokdonella sp.]MBX3692724.1 ATP-grasp domain-containing protein [Dokdonella sp.]MCW5567673.1 ATP-grasp domain-containing protein [Dokdonella sp.]HNR91129.1 biotin carboxylase N-terminal domain-containing protein [Dokdonella sp.]